MARRCAGDAAGCAARGNDLPRLAPQFFTDRPAEESCLRGVGDIPSVAVPEFSAACEWMDGAGVAAGGLGFDFVICAGSVYRAVAARVGTHGAEDSGGGAGGIAAGRCGIAG